MGETVEAAQRCGRFSVIARNGRCCIGGGAVGVNVAFGKAVLITACGNKDLVVSVCVDADVLLVFDARMGKNRVAAASEVGQRYLLRLIGLLSVDRGANGESE